jgi:hypothetical protein
VHCGGIIPPLEHPYDSPYAILHHSPRTITIQVGARDEIVSISRFKPSTDADDKPDSPRCCGQLPSTGTVAKLATTSRGSPSAPRRVLFSVPWPLHLYIRSSRVNAQEPFFPKPAGVFVCPGLAASSQPPHQCTPAPAETARKDRPLTSPPLMPSLVREQCGDPATPLDPDRLQRAMYCSKLCTACSLYSKQSRLYVLCYVFRNKPVLSQLLSLLLVHSMVHTRHGRF